VSEARVEVEGGIIASIGRGILVLVAFRTGDDAAELEWMAKKCLDLRIFNDETGKMNLSVMEVEGEVLVVSQFTLYGNCRKGRRPAYTDSAPGHEALRLYREFVDNLSAKYPRTAEGEFGAMMKVRLVNDGPVTLIVDREGR
jgi:D-tyrosyl-tRNA(Tyr) deacylase